MGIRLHSVAVALAALASATTLASGCSDSHVDNDGWSWSGPVGNIGLNLELAPGVNLTSIQYEIVGSNFTKTGTISVPGGGNTFSATISEIPVGNNHVIRLKSIAAGDAGIACAGNATFSVMESATTQVDIVLSCDLIDQTGSANVNGSFNICPSVTASTVTPTVQKIGGTIAVTLATRDLDNGPSPITYSWTNQGGTLSGATSASPTLTCTSVGAVSVTYTIKDGACTKQGTFNARCEAAGDAGVTLDGGSDAGSDAGSALPRIVINEVESNPSPDWVELYNADSVAVDISNWVFKDNTDSNLSRVPAGTVLQPGAYFIMQESINFTFGLGAGDSARLYLPDNATLVDSYVWTAHATDTYGRCPNGTGAFGQTTSTKGAANACGTVSVDAGVDSGVDSGVDAGTADSGVLPWPGSSTVSEIDNAGFFGGNMSGLTYAAGATPDQSVLWAVQNNPSKLYKLVPSGQLWVTAAGEWAAGKTIVYTTGSGRPDSESITVGGGGYLYVSTERDNGASSISRMTVLQYDPNASGTTLTALREWNLTSDLPPANPADANQGLEAISFISDAELAQQGFRENSIVPPTNTSVVATVPYDPNRYAQHGGGVFVVGVEETGMCYVFLLDHTSGAFTRVSQFWSGFPKLAGMEYDADTNYLWVWGDDTVHNQGALFEIDQNMQANTYGTFVLRHVYDHPAGLPDVNNEGIAFAPESECINNARAFYWADDNNTGSHALRRGSMPCGKSY